MCAKPVFRNFAVFDERKPDVQQEILEINLQEIADRIRLPLTRAHIIDSHPQQDIIPEIEISNDALLICVDNTQKKHLYSNSQAYLQRLESRILNKKTDKEEIYALNGTIVASYITFIEAATHKALHGEYGLQEFVQEFVCSRVQTEENLSLYQRLSLEEQLIGIRGHQPDVLVAYNSLLTNVFLDILAKPNDVKDNLLYAQKLISKAINLNKSLKAKKFKESSDAIIQTPNTEFAKRLENRILEEYVL